MYVGVIMSGQLENWSYQGFRDMLWCKVLGGVLACMATKPTQDFSFHLWFKNQYVKLQLSHVYYRTQNCNTTQLHKIHITPPGSNCPCVFLLPYRMYQIQLQGWCWVVIQAQVHLEVGVKEPWVWGMIPHVRYQVIYNVPIQIMSVYSNGNSIKSFVTYIFVMHIHTTACVLTENIDNWGQCEFVRNWVWECQAQVNIIKAGKLMYILW